MNLDSLSPISIDELKESAQLLSRVDRKYLVPPGVFAELVNTFHDEFRVLDIGNEREFDYHTVYFDSDDFVFFREHVQGRRHRHKVRTRTYRHSGECLVEIKTKGYRGRTEKFRQEHGDAGSDELTTGARGLIDRHLGNRTQASELRPVLTTDYRRSTLVHPAAGQRITCDTHLEFRGGGRQGAGPRDVLVETKSGNGSGPVDRWLISAGVRPHSVSKYCVAAALLYPHLRANKWHRIIRRYFTAGPATMQGDGVTGQSAKRRDRSMQAKHADNDADTQHPRSRLPVGHGKLTRLPTG